MRPIVEYSTKIDMFTKNGWRLSYSDEKYYLTHFWGENYTDYEWSGTIEDLINLVNNNLIPNFPEEIDGDKMDIYMLKEIYFYIKRNKENL